MRVNLIEDKSSQPLGIFQIYREGKRVKFTFSILIESLTHFTLDRKNIIFDILMLI